MEGGVRCIKLKYVKEKPDINVYIPSLWVFKFINPAISDTAMPDDASVTRITATTPTVRIDRLIEPIVYDMKICHQCIYERQALIDEVKRNMEE